VSTSTTTAENNLTFRNCFMRGGSYGFYNYGSSTQREENLVIENCEIYSYYRGIQLSNPQGTVIKNNRIVSNTYANYTSFAGIYLLSGVEIVEISGNYINSEAGNYGIYISATTNTLPTLIANNMIHVGGGTAAVYGIYFTGTCANFDLYHNSIHVSAPNTFGRTLQAASANTVGISVINNVMANTGGGFTYYFTTTTSGAVDVASHNCLYSTGGVLAYWNSTNQVNLSALQATSGKDQNSLSVDPGFFSATNLHATSGAMDDSGTPLAGITVDIDGDLRDLVTPDIGADEYDPIANDLSILGFVSPNQLGCDAFDSTEVSVMIFNNGTAPQTGFKVAFQIFAIQVANETVSATVQPGDTLLYKFRKKVLINVPAIYSFKAWVNPPDQNPSNDTISNYFVYVDRGVSNFPYLQNFNINQGATLTGWLNDPFDNNEEWQFAAMADGIPADVQGTGFFAYVENAVSNSDPINFLSPCFDLSGMARPTLEFQHWQANPTNVLHIDLLVDGEWIEDYISPLISSTAGWTFNRADLTPHANKVVKVRFRARVIGTTSAGDLGLDDVKVYDLPPINTGVIAAVQPQSGCGLTDIETVEIMFIHTGYDTLKPGDVVPVGFRVNKGPAFTEQAVITKVVPPLDTFAYEFFNVADLSTPGDYTIEAWTDYPTDNDVTNDTLSVVVTHVPYVVTYPYFEDFESGSGGWIAEGTASTWALGKPNGPVINQAIKGDNAWVTNLTGLYNNSENSFVGGPCFDFSTLLNPQIALDIWWDAENSYDGAAILYSIDGGINWSLLGAQNQGINWYNDNSINGAPGGQQVGWTGTGTTGSQFWRSAKLNAPLLAGQPAVLFRIHFGSETSVQDDGFAFDNIAIGNAPFVNIPDTIYGCGQVQIDGGVPGLSYIWSTGQTTRIATVTGSVDTVVTRVTVYAEDQYGLYAADTAVVIIAPGPIVDLGNDGLYCDVSPLILNAGNPGSSFRWDDGSTGQTREISADGTYFVEVTRAGCVKTDTITVELEESPVADFSLAKDSQNPNVVSFTNTSQNGVSYEWQFGNGYFSNQFEPTHFYPGAGTFQVMLIATNQCGSDTTLQSISIFPVGIQSPADKVTATISPNPASDRVVIVVDGEWTGEPLQIEVFDLQGRLVWQQQYNTGMPNQVELSLENWANGLYQVRLFGDNSYMVLPFVKQ
jgi:parallel beta-helix repeat protein